MIISNSTLNVNIQESLAWRGVNLQFQILFLLEVKEKQMLSNHQRITQHMHLVMKLIMKCHLLSQNQSLPLSYHLQPNTSLAAYPPPPYLSSVPSTSKDEPQFQVSHCPPPTDDSNICQQIRLLLEKLEGNKVPVKDEISKSSSESPELELENRIKVCNSIKDIENILQETFEIDRVKNILT